MQRPHHSLCSSLGLQIQEVERITVKTHLLEKQQVNLYRIYVDLASKEKNPSSETVRDPKVISNRKYASKENNQIRADVNEGADT